MRTLNSVTQRRECAGKTKLLERAATRFASPRAIKFLSYYKPYRWLLLADLLCAIVISAAALLLPVCANFIAKNLLATEGAPRALHRIYSLGVLMLALVALQTLCTLFVDYQGHVMGAKMERDMRRELFEYYQKLSFSFYDRQRTGQLMARITNDLFSLAELYHHGPEDLAISALELIGVMVILAHIDRTLTLIVLGFLPAMFLFALHFSRRMIAALRLSKDRIGDINARVEDSLAGIRVVKSFTNEAFETARFDHENNRFLASRSEGYRSEAWFSGGMAAFTQLITIAVIVFGAAGIARSALDLADLLTFLMCVAVLVDPIRRLVNFARLYQEGSTGFDRFFEMLQMEPELPDQAGAAELIHVRGDIALRDVSFRYSDDSPFVLEHVSLQIRAGEFVALVGASGVGKTTLCSLIPRFYDATAGDVLIDGRNVRDLRPRSIRQNVGIVQQDVYLFAATVSENLRYGKPGAGLDEIIEAAKQAHAHDFIMALPHGYDTEIGERGVKLSGGQKQRLSIARVFLKSPPILIFDEATSALDNESERAVQESLHRLARNRTTLVIAHRLSTVRDASRIVVLTEDGIAEEGTHSVLVSSGGAYARLYNTQASI
ncbi:ABC transporter ATP-binding protein [Candidatus Binatus sp.]|uniref:ABC transporter ATP-binding protein n=1 Tax=Candidatus Binatus sp. TaxID=2811406 RepID=UPI003CBA60D8